MLSLSLLALFIPTFFFASVTPGMCMTLAMTLGMTIGVRRTMWMMLGELVGIGLVSALSVLGVAALMLNYPAVFAGFKIVGGAYLIYLGVMMWRAKVKMAIPENGTEIEYSRQALVGQGFFAAVSNPKSWAFLASLLPPFISESYPLASQLSAMISIILLIEFACLMGYAVGGKTLRHLLQKSGNVQILNRISGSLMIFIGAWLAIG